MSLSKSKISKYYSIENPNSDSFEKPNPNETSKDQYAIKKDGKVIGNLTIADGKINLEMESPNSGDKLRILNGLHDSLKNIGFSITKEIIELRKENE